MTTPPVPAVDVALPDLSRWAAGNTGVPYVWRFGDAAASPRVTIQALTHGNEVCGAIALDWLLRSGFRPAGGALTLIFANTAAYQTFDAGDPFAARCLDEDFNRLWDAGVLDGTRGSRELIRARELRPFYDRTDFLLDLHSMTDPCPALALSGRRRKGLELARAIGAPQYIVIDAGHQAGRRLRDYAHFDDPDDPRNALLVECGQHWEAAAPIVAQQVMLRFLRHFDMLDRAFCDAHVDAGEMPPQRTIAITDVVTIETNAFEFARPVAGMMSIARRGTMIARDGDREIRTPHDDCVLIMPTRRPRKGETAVRLGRYVDEQA
ncbi:MAG TPA: succinylglutamate desuccinylase/aspartoacylase family protein [Casimicrobiaceae bacterium]|nr:succinylglutamate desuccinylase/aspartoacylase family protein [Casimicrobiaceae bacterium]